MLVYEKVDLKAAFTLFSDTIKSAILQVFGLSNYTIIANTIRYATLKGFNCHLRRETLL